MAVVRAGTGALRMDQIGFNAENGNVSYGPTDITVTSHSDSSDFTNFHGSYDYSSGFPVGTVDSIVDTVNGKTHYSVTGMNADATTLFSLIQQGRIMDAEAYVLRENDSIFGGRHDDYLNGFAGNDVVKAGAGADTLVGGDGADKLDGGAGLDTFLYLSTDDSTVARGGRDTILHFSHSDGDKIDLSAIDANENTGFNNKFSLVGAFSGHAGELISTAVTGGFLVQGDTDGINGADFSILVKTDAVALVAADFTL